MNELANNMQSGYDMFESVLQNVMEVIPGLIGFVLYLICALITYKLIMYILGKVLKGINMEKYVEKYFPGSENWRVKINPSAVTLAIVRFTLVIILVVLGSEILGFSIISHELSNLLSFVPKIVTAIALLLLGVYISGVVRRMLFTLLDSLELAGARLVSRFAGFLILFIITLIAIELLGIDTSIITNNLSIILGAFMICVAVAIGFGSVEIVKRILFGFYFKKNFKLGQNIRFDDVSGKIIKMDNISIILELEESTLVVPIKDLIDTKVHVLSSTR